MIYLLQQARQFGKQTNQTKNIITLLYNAPYITHTLYCSDSTIEWLKYLFESNKCINELVIINKGKNIYKIEYNPPTHDK